VAVAAYQLKSEMARVCLPRPAQNTSRRVAWTNSLCFLFLLVGIFGAQNKLPPPRHAAPIEQPVPIVVEPLPAPPPQASEQKPVERQNDDDKPEPQRFVAVTLDTPAIRFAVPTIGNLVVPMSVAPTPAPADVAKAAPAPQAPVTVGSTGAGGDRPQPIYPELAKQMGQQGTVVLLFTVDDVGAVTSISVKESSGSVLLDHSAQEWVKRKWIQPPVNGGHVFQVLISYKLQSD
jgi:periplasmic protein TonB